MVIDTNILIHWLNGDDKILNFFEAHFDTESQISVITEMETIIGADKHEIREKELKQLLSNFQIIPLCSDIGYRIVSFLQDKKLKSLRKVKLQDIIIACTALHLKKPLITQNTKDFKNFKGLQLINPLKSSKSK